MRKTIVLAVATVLLATAGFAGASIATGSGIAGLSDTATRTATVTVTVTTTTATTTTTQRRVTICHRTKSKRRPFVTLRINVSALAGHLRHGDHLGRCTGKEKVKKAKKGGKGKSSGKGKKK